MIKFLILFVLCLQPLNANELNWIIGESNSLPLALVEKGIVKEGILKEVAEAISKDLNKKLVFVVLPRGRVIQFLEEGSADGLCYIRPEWFKKDKDKLNWTDVLFINREIIVQRAGGKEIESFKELVGQPVGTVLNYSYEKLESLVGESIKRSNAPNMISNLLKLENERTQYAITDEFSFRYFLNQKSERLKIYHQLGLVVEELEIRCALSKKSKVTLDEVNSAIAKLKKKGVIEEVLKKYLGTPIRLKNAKQ